MVNYLSVRIAFAFAFSLFTLAQSLRYGIPGRANRSSPLADNDVNQDLVSSLPGQPKNVNVKQYAGYVTVNEQKGRALFYWFIEAVSAKETKPLVLWLNGGPGCSSVGYGAAQEIGPLLVLDGSGQLVYNNFSWSQEANLLFLESPVGVGYSYSNTTSEYNNLGDNITAWDTYNFLQNWLAKFKEYKKHELYIAGESYAGKYVPELVELIYDQNTKASPGNSIDIKGFMVGNPETHDGYDWQGLVDYAWTHAIVSDQTHNTIQDECDFHADNTWDNKKCSGAVDVVLAQYGEIDIYSVYTPKCLDTHNSTLASNAMTENFKVSKSTKPPMKFLGGFDPCLDNFAKAYFNRLDVQNALHAVNGKQQKNWTICNMDIFNNWRESRSDMLPTYRKLIKAGLRIWVYSGDTDGRVPVTGTRYCIDALRLPTKGPWRPWYHERQVAGWTQDYEGLTFSTFRAAGHAVPSFKPSESLAFFKAFISGTSLQDKRQ